MKSLVLLVLFSFVAVTLSQKPSPPQWPSAFSATVASHRSDRRHPGTLTNYDRRGRVHLSVTSFLVTYKFLSFKFLEFFRWFYDANQNKDRFDGIIEFQGERYFAEHIFDHTAKKDYRIFYQQGLAVCIVSNLNRTLPKPNFQNAEYIGKALINYEPAYHFYHMDRTNGFNYQVYERISNQRVIRIDLDDIRRHMAESFTFLEIDYAPQDKNLFVIPSPILSQCQSV